MPFVSTADALLGERTSGGIARFLLSHRTAGAPASAARHHSGPAKFDPNRTAPQSKLAALKVPGGVYPKLSGVLIRLYSR